MPNLTEKMNAGWLKDYTGKKFLPKTLVTQVYDMNGTLYYLTVEQRLAKKPGYITTDKMFVIEQDQSPERAGINAEIFNDLRLVEDKPRDTDYFDKNGIRQYGNIALGDYSHAEGHVTTAIGSSSHAEGNNTKAGGFNSHAEGNFTEALGDDSHAEGGWAKALGERSHAEGFYSEAHGSSSHAEGKYTIAKGEGSHAEGSNDYLSDDVSCALVTTLALIGSAGSVTYNLDLNSWELYTTHEREIRTCVPGISYIKYQNERYEIINVDYDNFIITLNKTLSADADFDNNVKVYFPYNAMCGGSHTEGVNTLVHSLDGIGSDNGFGGHAEGIASMAIGFGGHSEGIMTLVGESAGGGHAEGVGSIAMDLWSHAEGMQSEAWGIASHAEGEYSEARGEGSHAEGMQSEARGEGSHTEGAYTKAIGTKSHAEGYSTMAYGNNSHSENGCGAREIIYIIRKTTTPKQYKIFLFRQEEGFNDDPAYEKISSLPVRGQRLKLPDNSLYEILDYNIETKTITLQTDIDNKIDDGGSLCALLYSTIAIGDYSHAENIDTITVGDGSHAEGYETTTFGDYSHAEGYETIAKGEGSHAEGYDTIAEGEYSHVEGIGGDLFISITISSTSEPLQYKIDDNNIPNILRIFPVRDNSKIRFESISTNITNIDFENFIITTLEPLSNDSINRQTANILFTTGAFGDYSHAEGVNTTTIALNESPLYGGIGAHAEGWYTVAGGEFSHAEGYSTATWGQASHAEGYNTAALGYFGSHSEGHNTIAKGDGSHAEGTTTIAEGESSHAEGYGFAHHYIYLSGEANSLIYKYEKSSVNTISSLLSNRATINNILITDIDTKKHTITLEKTLDESNKVENEYQIELITNAKGIASHTEGLGTYVHTTGIGSHAEGVASAAIGWAAHAEGYNTEAFGNNSHAEGLGTIANGENQHVQGQFNKPGTQYAHIIGNGTDYNNRSNIHTIDWRGNTWSAGKYYWGKYNDLIFTMPGDGIEYVYEDIDRMEIVVRDKEEFLEEQPLYKYVWETDSYELASVDDVRDPINGVYQYTVFFKPYTIYLSYSEVGQSFNSSSNAAGGTCSHAEGKYTMALGDYSHAEGYDTKAGNYAHSEGYKTEASNYSHSEGWLTKARGNYSHTEGYRTEAKGIYSHTEGRGTVVDEDAEAQHVEGKYNKINSDYVHIVGNGSSNSSRSNAHTLDWEGNAWFAGDVYVHSTSGTNQDEGSVRLVTLDELPGRKNSTNNIFNDLRPRAYKEADIVALYLDLDNVVEGNVASGGYAHAEGRGTTASGSESHAEGQWTEATGPNSHSEGLATHSEKANGAHAEGVCTFAGVTPSTENEMFVFGPHAEGYNTTALGTGAHAEGLHTKAQGPGTHAEGDSTEALGVDSHAEGDSTKASGEYSHAEGFSTEASGKASHAEGYDTEASESYSHAEGYQTIASGTASHAEGMGTIASGWEAHTEGRSTTASGDWSHAEGYATTASGTASHAEGSFSDALGEKSHAEGASNTASGDWSHAEGCSTEASGTASHAEGYATTASGYASHAEGVWTDAVGDHSHAAGTGTVADGYSQFTLGIYNKPSGESDSYSYNSDAFIIGNGSLEYPSNAFRITYGGSTYTKSSYNSYGADYAEFFEWQDNNPNNEDRRGYFVTLDDDKIKIATSNDYILGVVSGQPSVIGNSDEEWMGRYIVDDFGCPIIEEFEYQDEIYNDKEEKEIITRKGFKYKENPNYDPNQKYIQRQDRPEWSAIGMLGMLSVRDDGTCKVNGYCTVNENGIATASNNGYRVIKRINDNIVKIIFK